MLHSSEHNYRESLRIAGSVAGMIGLVAMAAFPEQTENAAIWVVKHAAEIPISGGDNPFFPIETTVAPPSEVTSLEITSVPIELPHVVSVVPEGGQGDTISLILPTK